MTVKEAVLQLKTDLINWVTANLRTKVDKEALKSALDVKADLEYTDSELAKKSDTSHSHTPFVLHIESREDISKEPDLSSAEYATSFRFSPEDKPVVDFRTQWSDKDKVYLIIGHKYTDATNGADSKTFKSVTVDKCGHVIAGSNPTTLAEYGLSDDAYTKSEVDAKIAEAQLGGGNGGSIDLAGYVTEEELSNNYYTQTEVEDYVAAINRRNAGKRVQSTLYTVDGVTRPAQEGAEVFNAPNANSVHNIAIGTFSHAEGDETIALGAQQHVQGAYNIADTTSLHIVGNGTDPSERSNAHTIDWEGNAWFAGDVYVGSTSGVNRDEGSQKLVTESELAPFKECISDEYDSEVAFADTDGNVVARINENGLDTTAVVTDRLVLNGVALVAITKEEIDAMF
jgi:hypothetical protein